VLVGDLLGRGIIRFNLGVIVSYYVASELIAIELIEYHHLHTIVVSISFSLTFQSISCFPMI
jgi:hypothetical protein